MSNLFRNEYKVYLYKYNYSKLRDVVSDKFTDATSGSAYQYLFESFITDLYSLGIPSDEIRKDYQKYFKEYDGINNKANERKLKQSQKSGYTVTTYTPAVESLVDNDTNINAYRSPKTSNDNILQEALAQNYALQKLQKDYEDQKMMNGDNINWLNTKQGKIAYEQGLKSALEKSKELLNSLFDPVIDDIVNIRQSGKTSSDYVYCIELTDLSNTPFLDVPLTERTKNSCDKFLNSKVSNRLISDDLETNALSDIGTIKTDLTQITNTTSFTLRQDILLKYNIDIEPNDVIEIISTNYNKAINYTTYDEEDKDPLNRNTQFLGFVTQLSLSNKYGQVSDLTITCEGISKLLTMNPVVSDNAVSPQFNNLLDFIAQPKKNPSEATTVNVYVTQYNNSTVYELFTDIMSKVLAASPIDGDTTNYTVRYVSDPKKLKGLQYQYCKPLIVLYHLAASISTVRQCGPTEVIIAKVDCNILQTRLQAYLLQLRTNFTNFWSTYASPIQILNAIVENSFLEIYEDRCGILIMRTPRYNTWLGKDIIDMHDVIEWTQTINDVSLKSRSDYQWCIDYLGTMRDFPGGAYENVPALLKYGFRADSPKTSPNAKNEKLCAVFGALDVARANSRTRIIRVTVPMIQDYILGKLYYLPVQDKNGVDGLESVGCVGYLSSITSNVSPGGVDQHVLEFTYVRNAELLEEDLNLTGNKNYGKILNFNHLPDLEMMMNLFTEKDIEQPAKTNDKNNDNNNNSGLPAQYHYYWAAYEKVYKKIFDDYAVGTSNSSVTKKEKSYFDVTMAPTILSKGSFKSYKESGNTLSNNSYIPTQQLINNIWYIDMCLRYNENMIKDITTDNSDKTARTGLAGYKKYWGKLLRSVKFKDKYNQGADMKDVLDYLSRDATFSTNPDTSNKEAPTFISNSVSNPYAHVDNFFINESLIPSMCQPINQGIDNFSFDRLNNFAMLYKHAYEYITNPSYNKTQFIKSLNDYYKTITGGRFKEFTTAEFDTICKEIYNIIKEYDIYANNDYNFINLYFELLNNLENNTRNSSFINYMLEVYDKYIESKNNYNSYKVDIDTWTAISNLKDNPLRKDFGKQPLYNAVLNYIYAVKSSVKNKLDYKDTVQLAPAVIMKPSTPVPPLLIFKDYKYGSYLAGISPVDYKPFFKNQISNKIISEIPKKNGMIKLDDMTFRNSLNESIGTITGFVYDAGLSYDGYNLYFYPIIKFNKNVNISGYMNTESELRNFANGTNTGKKVLAVVCISPVRIPESKIPTIQQMANKGGLFVGKTDDKVLTLNNKAAIFDTSVLYKWTKSELNHAYSATIYNLLTDDFTCTAKLNNKFLDIRPNKSIKQWKTKIQSRADLEKSACVFNSSVNFNGLKDKNFDDKSVSENIEKIFDDLENINSQNKFFTITRIKGTTKYQLEDTVTTAATELVTDTIKLSYSYGAGDNSTVYKVSNDEALASVGGIANTTIDSFSEYTTSRENVQLALYTDNDNYSTIFYRDDKKYPTKVFRDTNNYKTASTIDAADTNYKAILEMQKQA